MRSIVLGAFFLSQSVWCDSPEEIRLHPGFVTKIRCEGRLLVSAVGDERLVRLEALPRELGCGVLVKPTLSSGRTNLVLETSAGSVRQILVVAAGTVSPKAKDLDLHLKGRIE